MSDVKRTMESEGFNSDKRFVKGRSASNSSGSVDSESTLKSPAPSFIIVATGSSSCGDGGACNAAKPVRFNSRDGEKKPMWGRASNTTLQQSQELDDSLNSLLSAPIHSESEDRMSVLQWCPWESAERKEGALERPGSNLAPKMPRRQKTLSSATFQLMGLADPY